MRPEGVTSTSPYSDCKPSTPLWKSFMNHSKNKDVVRFICIILFNVNVGIFYKIFLVSHNIAMNINNVM